uniref:Uncharacterized protein n=1 Tax=Parascaris univalens TaxID=6257 RepID=A0A915ACH3_PARUN
GNIEAQHANVRLLEHHSQRNNAGMRSGMRNENVLSAMNAHNCMYAQSSEVVNSEEVDVAPPLLTTNSALMLRRFLLNESEGSSSMVHVESQQQLASRRRRICARMDMRRWHSADVPSCFILNEQDLAGNLTPHSSTDSLFNNVNVAISDFMSEGP